MHTQANKYVRYNHNTGPEIGYPLSLGTRKFYCVCCSECFTKFQQYIRFTADSKTYILLIFVLTAFIFTMLPRENNVLTILDFSQDNPSSTQIFIKYRISLCLDK
jgi:hypothetical protein